MHSNWDTDFENQALKAQDYRAFLSLFFDKKIKRILPKPISYQQFSNKSGFASKSFAADIIAGRKKITPRSIHKVSLGLSLNKVWSQYFFCLVAKDEPSFWTEKQTSHIFSKKHKTLLSRILRKGLALQPRTHSEDKGFELLGLAHFPDVFAALGTLEHGATLDEIMARTNLSREKCQPILRLMMEKDLILFNEVTSCFISRPAFLDFVKMGSSTYFLKDYLRSLEKSKTRFQNNSQSEAFTFLIQTFTVKREKMVNFSKQLNELIVEFCDQAEDGNGDAIGELLVSFTHNKSIKVPENLSIPRKWSAQ